MPESKRITKFQTEQNERVPEIYCSSVEGGRFNMKSLLLPCIVCFSALISLGLCGDISCSFQKNIFEGVKSVRKPIRCGYERGWHNMLRANWNIVNVSRDGKIKERNRENEGGYFAYFEAHRRPIGYISRFVSPGATLSDDTCISFYYVNKGTKRSYPEGRSKLQVFFVPNGKEPIQENVPLWVNLERTSRNKWKKAEVRIFKPTFDIGRVRGRIVFEALRGRSKRSYIAVDDITVAACMGSKFTQVEKAETATKQELPPSSSMLPSSEMGEFTNFLRLLPARRAVETIQIAPAAENRARKIARKRGRRRRKNKKNSLVKDYNIVYYTEPKSTFSRTREEAFVPSLASLKEHRPDVLCDFMEYTHKLKRCLREFFSMLKHNKLRRKCNNLYASLETCLQNAASLCVPSHEMTTLQVQNLVSDNLRNKLKTQQVYCVEDGAFVFPEFSIQSLPLQCSREYFTKLALCGGSFAGLFNIKHGDPKLCSEYFTANECQRRTTADECNFDTRTMLVYGLSLQYQFAHNPFCIDLPFSAWWPSQ